MAWANIAESLIRGPHPSEVRGSDCFFWGSSILSRSGQAHRTNLYPSDVNFDDNLDGEALAAFGATGIDHRTAAASLHAHAKAVSAFAASNGGLVRTFHGGNPKNIGESPLLQQKTAMKSIQDDSLTPVPCG